MDKPELSVIIPCYNQGAYLLELLACFDNHKNQSSFEIIIVNDGSTDESTLSILSQVEQEGYHVLHQYNQGVCVARNNGINIAKGKFILPIDGDDKISLEYIFESIEVLKGNPEYSVVYCDAEYFGEKAGTWIIGEFNLQRLMQWNYLHMSSVFRKSAWIQVNGFDPQINGLEDWDFWLSIAFNGGRFFYLKKVLFQYRILSSSANRSLTHDRYKELIQKIEEKHSQYLSKEHLSDHFSSKFKGNKKLWLKLFLIVYFPEFLKKLVEKGRIDSIYID